MSLWQCPRPPHAPLGPQRPFCSAAQKDVTDLAPSVISSHRRSASLLQPTLLQTTVCPSLAIVENSSARCGRTQSESAEHRCCTCGRGCVYHVQNDRFAASGLDHHALLCARVPYDMYDMLLSSGSQKLLCQPQASEPMPAIVCLMVGRSAGPRVHYLRALPPFMSREWHSEHLQHTEGLQVLTPSLKQRVKEATVEGSPSCSCEGHSPAHSCHHRTPVWALQNAGQLHSPHLGGRCDTVCIHKSVSCPSRTGHRAIDMLLPVKLML